MKRSVYSVLTAILCTILMLPLVTVPAAAYGLQGDLNGDDSITAADADVLCGFLCGETDVLRSDTAYFADFDESGTLDARDLTLLLREAQKKTNPPELMPAPVNVLKPAMPSTGDVRLLLVMVDFWDCKFSRQFSEEEVRERVFAAGTENQAAPYPMDSIRAYYERASYDRLHIDGDVYRYSINNSLSAYADQPNALAEAVLAGLDNQIDYRNYDANKDGQIDTLMIAVPESAPNPTWWPFSIPYNGWYSYDGMYPGNLCIGNTSISHQAEFNGTWLHELGHAMGLPDYYFYENVNDDNYYGFNGDAGWEMMDKAQCDFCAFSKLMLGWYTPDEVQVYEGGTQTYRLGCSQEEPGCIVIPRKDLNGFLSEYFILEFVKPIGNNSCFYANEQAYYAFTSSGIRVMHCDASVVDTYYQTKELKWNNYGQFYDNSNLRQRVARLANNDEGGYFFNPGDRIDGSISGFHWYDENGFQTVESGIRISLENAKGKIKVTVSDGT